MHLVAAICPFVWALTAETFNLKFGARSTITSTWTFYDISIDHIALAKQGDNALGSVRPSVCLYVRLSVCLYVCPFVRVRSPV